MARIFITGSADGLGKMAAELLIKDGHAVVMHARNPQRAKDAIPTSLGPEAVLLGDLSSIAETKQLAEEANKLGPYDAIIHNAAVGYQEGRKILTADGLPHVFAINSLAPYILTCLIEKPKRLVYISSGLHHSGDASLRDLTWDNRPWKGFSAYSDSKLHNVLLAFGVARHWPEVYSNALEPGWVATKMGGPGAPDSLEKGPKTQVWLASSNDPQALVTGQYFYHQKLKNVASAARDINIHDRFLAECERLSAVKFPA